MSNRILIDICDDVSSPQEIMNKLAEVYYKTYGVEIMTINYELRYSQSVSNTHACPIDGVTNFMMTREYPTGYRGFTGNVTLELIPPRDVTFISNCFGNKLDSIKDKSIMGINLGSGGGTETVFFIRNNEIYDARRYTYNMTIFTEDFPSLHRAMRRKESFLKLKTPDKHLVAVWRNKLYAGK